MVSPTIRQCPTKTDGLLKLYLVGEDPGGPLHEATLAAAVTHTGPRLCQSEVFPD